MIGSGNQPKEISYGFKAVDVAKEKIVAIFKQDDARRACQERVGKRFKVVNIFKVEQIGEIAPQGQRGDDFL